MLWGLLGCIIVSGALVTQRRSGVVVPVVAIIAVFALRPRRTARMIPYVLVAAAIALAIVLQVYRNYRSIMADRMTALKH